MTGNLSENPLVTILVPCYNVEQYLEKCADSIINQNYTNLQIVMIDDGSTDRTWDILLRIATRDKRVNVYHQSNCGVAETRNNLLQHIKGEYVLFIDSDDWIEPNMVRFLIDELLRNNADLSICGLVYNNDPISNDYTKRIMNKDETIRTFLFHKDLTGSLCNKLVKTSLLHNLSFNKEISYGEDALFCWNFLQRINTVVMTDRQLYHYRMNQESISHQTFGDKKLTGYKVWETINRQVAESYPQYVDIALARWGIESMYLIRQASHSNYKKDSNIEQLQQTVRQNLSFIKSSGLLSIKELFNARMMTLWYGYGRLYYKLNRFKNKLK